MKNLLYLITCGFLLTVFGACQKDNNSSGLQQKLQGNWFRQNDWNADTAYREDYTFTADHKVTIIGSIIDRQNRVRGYMFKQAGSYSIKGDSLVLANGQIYTKGGLEVTALSDLPYASTQLRYVQQLSFLQPNLLHLIPPPCGPAELCAGFLVLTRK